ncbi:hypothetical protein NDU88_002354 [Pleurodeles waltl]|uniref:Secreted protein n=1 Tax=Pleurodeles waltl TaxID=8319 RepID=A0AAV7W1Y5_PLEWA|nr:hypothetical protein NDU88_002354 [Pleurodeles waltl]
MPTDRLLLLLEGILLNVTVAYCYWIWRMLFFGFESASRTVPTCAVAGRVANTYCSSTWGKRMKLLNELRVKGTPAHQYAFLMVRSSRSLLRICGDITQMRVRLFIN